MRAARTPIAPATGALMKAAPGVEEGALEEGALGEGALEEGALPPGRAFGVVAEGAPETVNIQG